MTWLYTFSVLSACKSHYSSKTQIVNLPFALPCFNASRVAANFTDIRPHHNSVWQVWFIDSSVLFTFFDKSQVVLPLKQIINSSMTISTTLNKLPNILSLFARVIIISLKWSSFLFVMAHLAVPKKISGLPIIPSCGSNSDAELKLE